MTPARFAELCAKYPAPWKSVACSNFTELDGRQMWTEVRDSRGFCVLGDTGKIHPDVMALIVELRNRVG